MIKKYPTADDIRIYPAWPQGRQDMFGRELFLSAIANRNLDIRGPWDLVFTLQDPFILEPIARNVSTLRAACKKKMTPAAASKKFQLNKYTEAAANEFADVIATRSGL